MHEDTADNKSVLQNMNLITRIFEIELKYEYETQEVISLNHLEMHDIGMCLNIDFKINNKYSESQKKIFVRLIIQHG